MPILCVGLNLLFISFLPSFSNTYEKSLKHSNMHRKMIQLAFFKISSRVKVMKRTAGDNRTARDNCTADCTKSVLLSVLYRWFVVCLHVLNCTSVPLKGEKSLGRRFIVISSTMKNLLSGTLRKIISMWTWMPIYNIVGCTKTSAKGLISCWRWP